MTKTKRLLGVLWMILLLVPISLSGQDDEVFHMVGDVSPEFPGGYNAMVKFIDETINYPMEAHIRKLEGEVHIRFLVTKEGKVDRVNNAYVKTLGYGLEEAAIFAIWKMPKWKPGLVDDKPANIWMKVPYAFKYDPNRYFETSDLKMAKDKDYMVPTFTMKQSSMNQYFRDSCGITQWDGVDVSKEVSLDLRINSQGQLMEVAPSEGNMGSELLTGKALQIAAKMKKWTPAKYKGVAYNSVFKFRVSFKKQGKPQLNVIETLEFEPEERIIFTFVEKYPEFLGGSNALASFFQKNLRYPAEALESGVSGTVWIKMVVNEDGSISDVRPYLPESRWLGYGLEQEAVRLVKLTKKWKPGMVGDKKVPVYHKLPVLFSID